MNPFLILFLIVLLLNVIAAFAPPTWMVFSYLGFRYPDKTGWLLAFVGASAATIGRFLLARCLDGFFETTGSASLDEPMSTR